MAEAAAIASASAAGLVALSKAKPALWDPLMSKIASSKDEKEVADALGEASEVLVCQMIDYRTEVESQCLKVPSETYRHWVEKVQNIEEQAKLLLAKRHKRSGILDFALRRPTMMKEMQNLGEKVGSLKEAGDQLQGKLFVGFKLGVLEAVVRNNETPDIKKFNTLQKPLEQMFVLLKNDKVYKLGIHGPLGIGKTTIMWSLNNHEEIAKLFDIVIWVKLSTEGNKENFSMERIQQAICRRLKLDLEGNNEPEDVKKAISMVLSYKKYLLLLDDVKEPPDLEKMGIPDNKNGSKVVLTTRLHHVCSLTVDRMIKVSYLTFEEAWKMFQEVVGQPKLTNDRKIGPLAWQVCKECSGLPLLIEKVASTLRIMNSTRDWEEGLNSWRMWPEKERQGIEELYNLFKFCYDDLDDDHQKKCFLYGALYPEDSEIYSDYLLECWVAEDLLGQQSDKIRSAQRVLRRLKNVSLLEQGKTENHVMMHKFIRQVALYILETDSEFKHLVKTNGGLREPPDVALWFEKKRISLGDNELCKLPDSPDCGELYTLFLQKNLGLGEIPESFFEYMENLRVLDLSDTGIKSLPPSFLLLIELKILYLNNCKLLKSLPTFISKLEHLEALDIRGTEIGNVPIYIGNMINLRRLRVSFGKSGNANAAPEDHFGFDIISKLSRLEELDIDVKTPDEWSNEVAGEIINAVAPLENFKTLKFLFPDKIVEAIDVTPNILCIHVPESRILSSFIKGSRWRNVQSIKSFQIFVSDQNAEHPELINFMKYVKYVKYCNGKGSNFPVEVLSVADAFELFNHKDIKQLSDTEIGSMNNLQGCLVESCVAFETVVGATSKEVLPNLEHLFLKNLPNLKSIFEGSLRFGSLSKIKTLAVTGCHILTEVLPSGVIQQLCRIEHLTVEDCQEIKELFSSHGSPDVLPKLKKLKLIGNRKLTKVCKTNALNWPSLEKLKISDCPRLRELPFNEVNAAELKLIKAEQEWWDSINWQKKETKAHLQKHCILRP